MKKSFLSLSLVLLSLSPAWAQVQAPACCPENKTITLDIAAEATIKTAPDMATITAGVVTQSATANAALKQNAEKMSAVFNAIKVAGIAEKDIQTQGLSINPQYNYQENKAPKIMGYEARNSVIINMHDLKTVGSVLDALVKEGANEINGPDFSVEHPDDLTDQARKQAVLKARHRAELYAEAAGLKIKRIVSISESTRFNPGPVRPMMAMAKMAAADEAVSSPVASGQMDMTANVNISFELGE